MKRSTGPKMKITARQLGENISTWRKLYGITSQDLAERSKVSRSTLSRLENGDPSVSLETFLNVCKALSILDLVVKATDPYESDLGRIRSDMILPKRVRSKK